MAAQQMDLESLKGDIAEKAEEAMGTAVEFARANPHAAVAIAFGVGWVLGNGIPPRLVMGVARLGAKAALGGLLASGGLASLIGGSDGEEAPSPQPPLANSSSSSRSGGTRERTTRSSADR